MLHDDDRPDVFVTAIAPSSPMSLTCSRVATTVVTTAWSNGIFDFDNDGRKDLFAVNGALNESSDAVSGTLARQRSVVPAQQSGGTFEAVSVWSSGAD